MSAAAAVARPRSTGRPRALVLVVTMLVAAVGCAPPPIPPEDWSQVDITRDGGDVTSVAVSGPASVTVTSPATNIGANSRSLFWRSSAPVSRDHRSCTTATHSGLPVQEGVALRVAPSATGIGTRAITVQKNIYADVGWVYNVHLWDTASPGRAGGTSVAHLAGHDLHRAIVGAGGPSDPRRLCARVRGSVVELKVWPGGRPEPAWDDATHVRSTPLPPGWDYDGRPGFYIGHVPPGGHAAFTAMVDLGPEPQQAARSDG